MHGHILQHDSLLSSTMPLLCAQSHVTMALLPGVVLCKSLAGVPYLGFAMPKVRSVLYLSLFLLLCPVTTTYETNHDISPALTSAGSGAKESFIHNGDIIIKELGRGMFATVHAYIPVFEADQILGDHEAKLQDRSQTFTRLRANIQAVKICHENIVSTERNTFANEIQVLRDVNKANHPNIVLSFTTGTHSDHVAWYTMELLSGGDLAAFLSQYSTHPPQLSRPPLSFAWHVLKCMADALLLLHFGIIGNSQARNWPGYYHRDIKSDNILFRMPARGKGFEDYPDAVLADFRWVQRLDSNANQPEKDAFFKKQKRDVQAMTLALEPLVSRTGCTDSWLNDLFDRAQGIKIVDGRDANEAVKSWLLRVSKEAAAKRQQIFEPLAADVQDYFLGPVVTDAELESAFPQLADQA